VPAANPLAAHLARGPLLLSGGFGTELQRRGHPTPLPLWSTATLLEAPEAVRALHADYVRAGARLVTANTFRTGRATVAPHGHNARKLTRLAVELARAGIADAEIDDPVLLAGSLAPVADCYMPDLVPDEATLRAEHGLHIGALVAAGVDLVLIETMNTIREAVTALGAARAGLLPALISLHCNTDGKLLSGEDLAEAVAAVTPLQPLAILINCCAPALATTALRTLRANTHGPVGAYANGAGCADEDEGWRLTGAADDDAYAAHAADWLAAGASIVGGCCGTTPATITRLASLIEAAPTQD
jgi:S-methylmethionine-dependent homocysteine/selenocysteine methylase